MAKDFEKIFPDWLSSENIFDLPEDHPETGQVLEIHTALEFKDEGWQHDITKVIGYKNSKPDTAA